MAAAPPPRWLGGLAIAVVLLHALLKVQEGRAGDALWACFVAAAVVGLGVVTRSALMTAAGFLFQIGVGLPSWVVYLVVMRETTATAMTVHLLTPLVGVWAVRHAGCPPAAPWAALGFWVAMEIVSYAATDPALNVNLAHAPFAGLGALTPNMWLWWPVNAVLAFLTMRLAFAVVRRAWPVRP